jgi:hypothetical protein
MYAHSYDRDWECDTMFFEDENNEGIDKPEGLYDIAWQLVNREPGNKAKVVLGGGAPAFFPKDRMAEVNAKVSTSVMRNHCFELNCCNQMSDYRA